MASVFKPKRYRRWQIKYKNEHDKWVTVSGFRDKQATLAKARELEKEVEQIKAGLRCPETKADVSTLFEQYLDEFEHTGKSESHTRETKRLLHVIQEECKWTTLDSIRPEPMREMLKRLRTQNKAPRTINSYRDAAVAFLNWCVAQEYTNENVLDRIPKAKGEKRKDRRAYTMQEFRGLLDLNNERKLIYQTLGLSGFRSGELAAATKQDLNPTGTRPIWKLRAKFDKSRKLHIIPMLPELAKLLKDHWSSLKAKEKLFPCWPRLRTLNRDLERAYILKIDENGQHLDFHSFRYFFCVQMARRLPIQVVTRLMRHASIQMTADVYGQLELDHLTLEVSQLPTLLNDADSIHQNQDEADSSRGEGT